MPFLAHTKGNAWLLCLHKEGDSAAQKDVIKRSGVAYYWAKWISPERCFTNRSRDVEAGWFKELKNDSLKPVGQNDKLWIVAHGSQQKVAAYDPEALARLLKESGLTKAGLITFCACNVGAGDFLTKFVYQASVNQIVIGWVKGYCGSAATVPHPDGDGSPHERIRGKAPKRGKLGNELDGDARYKIVSGIDNPFKQNIGRYLLDDSDSPF